ncbi:MAG: hypothetical protein ACKVU2_00460 [Saprospiraceae bacterium]
MEFTQRKLAGTWEIQLAPLRDERGFFMRAYDTALFEKMACTAPGHRKTTRAASDEALSGACIFSFRRLPRRSSCAVYAALCSMFL